MFYNLVKQHRHLRAFLQCSFKIAPLKLVYEYSLAIKYLLKFGVSTVT
ncbi:MAG: hypothetical protein ACI9CE_002128 [Flavobacterium sp.]|jgi:hypothetical protein